MEPHDAAWHVTADAVGRAHARAGAARWDVSLPDFTAALTRSVVGRYGSRQPSPAEVAAYLETLQLEDLALAVACAAGRDAAWEHFVRAYRPVILRLAVRHAPPDAARDVADSLYGDLFGTTERDGRRRSLFDYYHGRSSLAGWLRAVVSQRLVDRAREAKRTTPLPEPGDAAEPAARSEPPDPDRGRLLTAARAALQGALAALVPRDRLRLSLYYTQNMTLAAIGGAIGESEATASRKLERTRRDLRAAVEATLRGQGLGDAAVDECFEHARTDPAFDLARDLGG
jgi:RNA polymerase sigma-70 factor (ECF subfamily)